MVDMTWKMQILKPVVAALFFAGVPVVPVFAQTSELDELFERLKIVEPGDAEQIENMIWAEWSRSGSPSMDLLLQRGREAMEAEDLTTAIEHFSALVDHAPDFAEGYNARAMAYFRQARYGLAIEDIRQTLTLNPRHFGAMSGLALIMEELGFPEDALDAWREVIALNPHAEGADEAVSRLAGAVEGTAL